MAVFSTLPQTKVMRDPIHGYIHVNLAVIWDLIDTYEFQRLRRIRQLGGTYMVYHTAEHSRFAHSLGVYEIVRRMVSEVQDIQDALTEYEKVTVLVAALLHDIGHGPFSHAFEQIAHTNHEAFTVRMLLEDTSVHDVLMKAHPDLATDAAAIINHEHNNQLLCQMVSGQLDADRMDYLLRDSYFTGTSYGNFDLERLLRTLRVVHGKLVVKESGMHTVEDYIMCRYHMYYQVYYHPLSRSYEALITALFARLRDMLAENPAALQKYPMFEPFLTGQHIALKDYIFFDEPAALYGIHLLTLSENSIAQDLAMRIVSRQLFATESVDSNEQITLVESKVAQGGYDTRYYFHHDESIQVAYKPYATKNSDIIEVVKNDGSTCELSQISSIVAAITVAKSKNDKRVFFPKGLTFHI